MPFEGQQLRRPRLTFCHKEVRKVAQAACHELYDVLMQDNRLYEEWKRQNPELSPHTLETRFVAKNWPRCIEFARATLAHMLTRADINEKVKDQILEVLVLDASVPVGRTPPGRAVQIARLEEAARKEGWRP